MAESKEVALITTQEELVTAVSAEWGRSKDEIKAMISVSFPTLKTVGQLVTAFTAAKKWDLDPQAKEIYAYVDFRGNMALIVGKDGFLKIARKQTGYKQIISASVFAGDDFEMNLAEGTITRHIVTAESLKARTGNPIGAYAILRMEGLPDIIKWAEWSEYAQAQGPWTKQKSAMICKCATSTLIREAFGVSGLYDEAEVTPEGSFDNTAYIEPEKVDKFKRMTNKEVKEKSTEPKPASADIKIETPVVEEAVVEEVKEETPKDPVVTEETPELMSEKQASRIMEIFEELGYDGNQAQDKIEELEKKFDKAFAEFLEEEADKVIVGMEKSLAKKKAETTAPAEEKKSAVGAMGEKAKAEQEAIKNSPEFRAAFPEETPAVETPKVEEKATAEVAGEVFDTGMEEDEKANQSMDERFDITDELLEGSNEEELRSLRATAKEAFSLAVAKYKETGKNEDLAERSRLSGITSRINQMLIQKGYDI